MKRTPVVSADLVAYVALVVALGIPRSGSVCDGHNVGEATDENTADPKGYNSAAQGGKNHSCWSLLQASSPASDRHLKSAALSLRSYPFDPNTLSAANSFDGMQADLDQIKQRGVSDGVLLNATATIVSLEPRIIVVDDFLTSAEADHLVATRSGQALSANTVVVDTGRRIGMFSDRYSQTVEHM